MMRYHVCLNTAARKTEGRSQTLEPVHRVTEETATTNTPTSQACCVGDSSANRDAAELDLIVPKGEPLLVKFQRT